MKCVIVVDDKHPGTPEGYHVATLLACLRELASQQEKDIVFVFVYAEDGFTEPMTVYLVTLHAIAACRAGYTFAGLASDCWKQGTDLYGEGQIGGLLLLDALRNLDQFPVNSEQFAAARSRVVEDWNKSGIGVSINDVLPKDLPTSFEEVLDDAAIAFYTATFVDVKKLEKKYQCKIVWVQALQPMDRAIEIFKELGL
jgi:hypothetical protein